MTRDFRYRNPNSSYLRRGRKRVLGILALVDKVARSRYGRDEGSWGLGFNEGSMIHWENLGHWIGFIWKGLEGCCIVDRRIQKVEGPCCWTPKSDLTRVEFARTVGSTRPFNLAPNYCTRLGSALKKV